MRNKYADTTNNELVFFVLGVSVGVVAALLMAPYSGAETRHYIRERVDDGRDRAGDLLERGKEFVDRGRGSAGDAVEYGRKTVQEKI